MGVLRFSLGLLLFAFLVSGIFFGYSYVSSIYFNNELPTENQVSIKNNELDVTITRNESARANTRRRGGERSKPVVAVKIIKEQLFDTVEAIGTLQANESIFITAKVQGIIKSINFDEGNEVKKGDVLVKFKEDEQTARLEAELANLEEQQKQFQRIEGLAQSNAASRSRFDQQQASVKKALANVEAAQARLDDYTIKAAFSGRLGTRKVSTGALVSPGTVITTLDDLSVMKLDFSIPETFLSALQKGLEIEAISSAYQNKIFSGIVETVDTRIEPSTRSIAVRAKINNKDGQLRPGMLMVVNLIKNKREGVTVPEESIVPLKDKQYIFIVDEDNLARRLEVITGQRKLGRVEILTNLNLENLIITEGNSNLFNGNKVRVINVNSDTSKLETKESNNSNSNVRRYN